ncbi:5'-methylthioadenosine/adenosylhomocysteine nucleosidase [Eubacterium barkeri]|uniref:adenosylhomocysteine nucleosidase n=1 Tax=Eubacterium barkeri TaxID=1528 RepID=A0A1H3DSA9_EUBBA|nr:5'-methylthioadenosine/adenosylhomocysteine nucleosidase [Eubacterium barkeri]SDX69190.1 adenosylhomocysteine nucleosidase [Eubacterium barkeri]
MIGIIAALKEEVEGIVLSMTVSTTFTKAGMTFVSGKINGKEVTAVQCGVGKVNAALCTQILIDCYGVDCLINLGVAGALASGLDVGDIVLSKDAMQYDMDATPAGFALGEIPEMGVRLFEADPDLLSKAKAAAAGLGIPALAGRVLTADRVVASGELKAALATELSGACVEMEGAAVAQTAWVNGIPFMIIRSISDHADEALEATYDAHFEESVANASRLVLALVSATAS